MVLLLVLVGLVGFGQRNGGIEGQSIGWEEELGGFFLGDEIVLLCLGKTEKTWIMHLQPLLGELHCGFFFW